MELAHGKGQSNKNCSSLIDPLYQKILQRLLHFLLNKIADLDCGSVLQLLSAQRKSLYLLKWQSSILQVYEDEALKEREN